MANIKAGDTVAIIAGGNQFITTTDKKGVKTKVRQTGRVVKVLKNDRVIIEGINKVKKHQRPTQENEKGGIIEMEAPIHISNVALIDPKTNTPTRVGVKVENGSKIRYAKKSGAAFDKASKKK
jgi:large subunit ribosomal protein L24